MYSSQLTVILEALQLSEPELAHFNFEIRIPKSAWNSIGEFDTNDLPVGISACCQTGESIDLPESIDIRIGNGERRYGCRMKLHQVDENTLINHGITALYDTKRNSNVVLGAIFIKIERILLVPYEPIVEVAVASEYCQTERRQLWDSSVQVVPEMIETSTIIDGRVLDQQNLEAIVLDTVMEAMKNIRVPELQEPQQASPHHPHDPTPAPDLIPIDNQGKDQQIPPPSPMVPVPELGFNVVPRFQQIGVLDKMIAEKKLALVKLIRTTKEQDVRNKAELIKGKRTEKAPVKSEAKSPESTESSESSGSNTSSSRSSTAESRSLTEESNSASSSQSESSSNSVDSESSQSEESSQRSEEGEEEEEEVHEEMDSNENDSIEDPFSPKKPKPANPPPPPKAPLSPTSQYLFDLRQKSFENGSKD